MIQEPIIQVIQTTQTTQIIQITQTIQTTQIILAQIQRNQTQHQEIHYLKQEKAM